MASIVLIILVMSVSTFKDLSISRVSTWRSTATCSPKGSGARIPNHWWEMKTANIPAIEGKGSSPFRECPFSFFDVLQAVEWFSQCRICSGRKRMFSNFSLSYFSSKVYCLWPLWVYHVHKAQPRLQAAIDARSPSLSRHGVVPEGHASGGSPRPGWKYGMI